MNTTGGGMFDAPSLGGVGYGISVFVGILFLISTITLTSYFCTRNRNNQPAPASPPRGGDGTAGADVEAHPAAELRTGIDEATLKSYPRLVYSRSSTSDQAAAVVEDASCCAICLADYKDADVLRLLPDCKHRFHMKCVDPWLRLHPTCPVCRRTSPLPSPLPSPVAEVVPLARQYS